MLNTLRKIIGKQHAEVTANQSNNNPNFITEQDRIVHFIKAIEASSQLCTVKINGFKKIFSTSLLDFNPDQGYLTLDQISPAEGNSILQIVKVLQLSAFINGIPLSFKLDIIDYGLKQGIPYYNAGLPNRIYHPQRRKAPRIPIEGSDTILFRAQPQKTGQFITGKIFDLSRDGLCINFAKTPYSLEHGNIVKNCRITLPDGYTITFDLAVRSTKTLRNHNIQVGGHFLNMPPKSKKKLEYFIALLERETIRKQKN